jgi:hypothetical protein|tara:strand:+ start:17321 stop:18457 length:1137 start_codon:yes stop_codon:yes gene_type:complete
MRFLLLVCAIFIFSCQYDEVNKSEDNWTKIIYETSSLGIIEASTSVYPVLAFSSNFYKISGADAFLTETPKEDIYEFNEFELATSTSLKYENNFVFGGVDHTNLSPIYGIKLMNDEFDSKLFFHENVAQGVFFAGSSLQFHSLLTSPLYLNTKSEPTVNATLCSYTYAQDLFDTLSTQNFEITNVDPTLAIDLYAVKSGDQVFFVFQQRLFLWDAVTGEIKERDTGEVAIGLYFLNDQLILQPKSNELKIYDKSLGLQESVSLSAMVSLSDYKTTILKIFIDSQDMYVVVGESKAESSSDDVLTEVTSFVSVLTIGENWELSNRKVVLQGNDYKGTSLLWERFDLISQDIKNDVAYFLFKRPIGGSKYEYLVKRTALY